MRKHHQRLILTLTAGLALIGAVGLMLVALRDSVVYFYTPTELVTRALSIKERARLGGLVVEGSLKHDQDRVLYFEITDRQNTIPVRYPGEPTALFKEGRSVIVEGVLDPKGIFKADLLLAKHDENYMPREIADSLKEAGQWYGKESGGYGKGNAYEQHGAAKSSPPDETQHKTPEKVSTP